MSICEKCKHFKKCDYAIVDLEKCINYAEEQTNEEWLRQATTEQLAEWIVHLADDCTMQHECGLCNSWCDEKSVVEWLRKKHETKDTNEN